MEQTPGATVLSAKWVVTNKGIPKAPVREARRAALEFASNALDRDTMPPETCSNDFGCFRN